MMKRKTNMWTIVMFVSLSWVSVPSITHAIPLSNLLSGDTIISGDKLFDDFRFFDSDASPDIPPSPENIIVNPVTIGDEHGLQFQMAPELSVTEGEFLKARFSFSVTALGNNWIADATQTMNLELVGEETGPTATLGNIDTFFSVPLGPQSTLSIGSLNTRDSALPFPGVFSDHVEFHEPHPFVNVSTKFLLQGGRIPGASVTLREYTITLSQVPRPIPVPGTLLLIGIGLIGLGLARRRMKG